MNIWDFIIGSYKISFDVIGGQVGNLKVWDSKTSKSIGWWTLSADDQCHINEEIEKHLVLEEMSDAEELRRSEDLQSQPYIEWINGGCR